MPSRRRWNETTTALNRTESQLAEQRRAYSQLEKAAEDETRRCNGNYLRAKGELREAQEDLEDQRVEAQVAMEAAMNKELGLLDLLEDPGGYGDVEDL